MNSYSYLLWIAVWNWFRPGWLRLWRALDKEDVCMEPGLFHGLWEAEWGAYGIHESLLLDFSSVPGTGSKRNLLNKRVVASANTRPSILRFSWK